MTLIQLDQLCHEQICVARSEHQDQLRMQNCKHCNWKIIVLQMEGISPHLFSGWVFQTYHDYCIAKLDRSLKNRVTNEGKFLTLLQNVYILILQQQNQETYSITPSQSQRLFKRTLKLTHAALHVTKSKYFRYSDISEIKVSRSVVLHFFFSHQILLFSGTISFLYLNRTMAQASRGRSFFRGGMGRVPAYFMWSLWSTNYHWDRFCSEYLGFTQFL